MDCSYKLDSIEAITPRSYDTFWHILGTLLDNSELAARVLEAVVRFRKRSVRQARSHVANTSVSSLRRKPILSKRLNPNNRDTTPLGAEIEDTTQLARRNSEP